MRPRSPSATIAISRAPIRPGFSLGFDVVVRAIGVPDIRHWKFAPRASLVPFFAASAFFGLPTFTVKR